MIIITIRRIYFFVRGGKMNSLGTAELYLLLGPVLYCRNIKWVTDVNLVLCLVAQSCPTLCDPMDCSPPGSSVHGILQVKILEWVAISSSRGSFHRDWTHISWVSCVGRQILYHCATWEVIHTRKENASLGEKRTNSDSSGASGDSTSCQVMPRLLAYGPHFE